MTALGGYAAWLSLCCNLQCFICITPQKYTLFACLSLAWTVIVILVLFHISVALKAPKAETQHDLDYFVRHF